MVFSQKNGSGCAKIWSTVLYVLFGRGAFDLSAGATVDGGEGIESIVTPLYWSTYYT